MAVYWLEVLLFLHKHLSKISSQPDFKLYPQTLTAIVELDHILGFSPVPENSRNILCISHVGKGSFKSTDWLLKKEVHIIFKSILIRVRPIHLFDNIIGRYCPVTDIVASAYMFFDIRLIKLFLRPKKCLDL